MYPPVPGINNYNPQLSKVTGLWYCGLEVMKNHNFPGPMTGVDGRCGPIDGPNCPSCIMYGVGKGNPYPLHRVVSKDVVSLQGETGLFYCGGKFVTAVANSNGFCGPNNGPNCLACSNLLNGPAQRIISLIVAKDITAANAKLNQFEAGTISSIVEEVVNKCYDHTNIYSARFDDLVKFVDAIPKFFGCAKGLKAIYDQMMRNNHLNSYKIFGLAYAVKKVMINGNYESLCTETKALYEALKSGFADAVRRAIWDPYISFTTGTEKKIYESSVGYSTGGDSTIRVSTKFDRTNRKFLVEFIPETYQFYVKSHETSKYWYISDVQHDKRKLINISTNKTESFRFESVDGAKVKMYSTKHSLYATVNLIFPSTVLVTGMDNNPLILTTPTESSGDLFEIH